MPKFLKQAVYAITSFVIVGSCNTTVLQAQVLLNGKPAHWYGNYSTERCELLNEQWHDWQKMRDEATDKANWDQRNEYFIDGMNEYNAKCH